MKKTYGRSTHVFADIATSKSTSYTHRDVFSDSSSSSGINDSLAGDGLPKRKTASRDAPLRDVSNVGKVQQGCRITQRKAKQSKYAQATNMCQDIPNFDSFDEYSLMVQPVTPIKTHISQSSSSNWEKVPSLDTEEYHDILASFRGENVVTSSPRISQPLRLSGKCQSHSAISASTDYNSDASHYSGRITRSIAKSLATSAQSSDSRMSRRAKRIRQITSTPEQQQPKMSRLISPEHPENMSHIPLEMDDDVGELVESMHHVSLHESLHEKSLCASSNSQHISETDNGVDHSEWNPSSTLSGRDAAQSKKVSAGETLDNGSLISTQEELISHAACSPSSQSFDNSNSLWESSESDYNPSSHYENNINGNLASIIEEEEEEVTDTDCRDTTADGDDSYAGTLDESTSCSYQTANENQSAETDCSSPKACSYHTPLSPIGDFSNYGDSDFSDEKMQHLIAEMERLQSPSLAEMSKQRRERSILRHCGQRAFINWYDYMPAKSMSSLVKIGEGVYGEVFLRKNDGEVSVMKVVPMGGSCTVNDEPQKKLEEMKTEARITRILSNLRCNFIEVKTFVCVEGAYPNELLKLWDAYDEENESENDRPDYFPVDQQYLIFEFADGGQALETYEFKSASEGLSLILQIAISLAVAEDSCQFEHRDLHWSNILVKPTTEQSLTYTFKTSNDTITIATSGIHVNIIDFTLSRLMDGEDVMFCDLSTDETLFEGEGDYQFDVYRQMRDVTQNDWRRCFPITNVLWMRYLLDKLLKMKSFPSRKKCVPTVSRLKTMMMALYKRSEKYYSCVQMVHSDVLFDEYTS